MKNLSEFMVALVAVLIFSCQTKEKMLPSVTTFEGKLTVSQGGFENFSNRIKDFATIETVNGDVLIKDFDEIYLSFLKNIKTINGNLEIIDSKIINLDFFSSLESVSGNIRIEGNRNLISLKGLEKLKKAKGLTLNGNFGNGSFIDLVPIQNIMLTETLNFCYLLNDSFPLFKNLNTLSSFFFIYQCDGIKNLKSFSNLTSIANCRMVVGLNDSLKSLEGLDNITSVGSAYIHINTRLETLKGLDNLKTVAGLFSIYSNPLKSISNLKNLNRVDTLELSYTECDSLNGLENLLTCKKLQIKSNPLLTNFCALKPLFLANNAVEWHASYNLQNPTIEDVKSNCQ